ncbi:PmoA family protein [Symmachiella dynata]|uniref:DUF6807 domain-containing protein n=1 Tax=Symmachiella dynata TaxID=2527995 RepID=UPI0030EBEEE3
MLTRRKMIAKSLGAASVSGIALAGMFSPELLAIDYPQPVPEANGLTAYCNHSNLIVRYDNLPILSYRAQSNLKYPYFYPLNGPKSGLPLTTESALPYPHHRSLWLGCDPLNGGNYWGDNALKTGQIRSVELALDTEKQTDTSVTFNEKCEWTRPGSTPLKDVRQYTVTRPHDSQIWIDCEFGITAIEDISIKRAKHSFFAMRAASDISPAYGGTLMNSHGDINAKGTYGKTADWCGYFGKRKLRPDLVEGICIMNHPDNFGGNCPWFTRDYGHLSPSPLAFLKSPWTMSEGETLDLRYRVVLHVGTPQEAKLNELFQQWIAV